MSIDALLGRMRNLQPQLDPIQRYFHDTYLRTTEAVQRDLAAGGFEDPEWVERWDVAFADFYLHAIDAHRTGNRVPGPWKIAFDAAEGPRLPPLRHVLLGMNAHVNYDLPQALLAVITDEEFDDETVRSRRNRDHAHVDAILASRVAAEDGELRRVEQPGDRTLLDRLLQPFNRFGTKQFLAEARRKVWTNAQILSRARRAGVLEDELSRLEAKSAERVGDLVRPGQVLINLAIHGFGVELDHTGE